MKTPRPLILSAALHLAALVIPLQASQIDLPEYGFQVEALDSKPGDSSVIPLMMCLPVSEGFAPNININIQPYAGSIQDYAALSKGQFKEMSWIVITEKQVGDSEWVVEYKGPMQGKDLHFYARAVSKGGKVYLVTGAAKESQWATVGEKLTKHVDSFKTK